MRENRYFVVPVNILTLFACAPFSWAARHTTVCLDILKNSLAAKKGAALFKMASVKKKSKGATKK